MDLGITPKNPDSLAVPQEAKGPTYPGFSVNDDQVDAVKELLGGDCKMGDTYTITGTIKVRGMSDDNYGKSLNFDLTSIDSASPAGENSGATDAGDGLSDAPGVPAAEETAPEPGDTEDADTADEETDKKVLGYSRKNFAKKNKKEAAPVSAKDLEY